MKTWSFDNVVNDLMNSDISEDILTDISLGSEFDELKGNNSLATSSAGQSTDGVSGSCPLTSLSDGSAQ